MAEEQALTVKAPIDDENELVIVQPHPRANTKRGESPRLQRVYALRNGGRARIEALVRLVVDPIADVRVAASASETALTVFPKPQVLDREAVGIRRLLEREVAGGEVELRVGRRYVFDASVSLAERARFEQQHVSPAIEDASWDDLQPTWAADNPKRISSRSNRVQTISLRDLDDEELDELSARRRLSLTGDEMRRIAEHFRALGREPSLTELEALAQTWSEHCCHKTFRAPLQMASGEVLTSMLERLRSSTTDIDADFVISAFVDDAGVIAIDDEWALALKMETHNRPSALAPFAGAHTGIGGVIRDVLAVGARPIALSDVLCFGDDDESLRPAGVLPPSAVEDGVVAGIADYGNKMGLPTVSGAVVYHSSHAHNPLVFCGAFGLLPRARSLGSPMAGDHVIVIGGGTGRDGLRGATFSSSGLSSDSAEESGTAVQVGAPITERALMEMLDVAHRHQLIRAMTDCGAGGLSSAVTELAGGLGARVELSALHLKYEGLAAWELWLSESQERMVLAVAPEHSEALSGIANEFGVGISNIGRFEASGRVVVELEGERALDLELEFLLDGWPNTHRSIDPISNAGAEPEGARPEPATSEHSPSHDLLQLLGSLGGRSREPVIRRFDHEVGGRTRSRPFGGSARVAPLDGAVLSVADQLVALSVGLAPRLSEIDPYAMAWWSVDEAIRNLVAAGGDPTRVALMDNFAWGDVDDHQVLAALSRAVDGCADAARAYSAPFVSGKDSLRNAFTEGDHRRDVRGTLVVSGLALSVRRASLHQAFSSQGALLYLIGDAPLSWRGSLAEEVLGRKGPLPQVEDAASVARLVHRLIVDHDALGARDISEGGLLVALAEMCMSSGFGLDFDGGASALSLFGESMGRYLVAIRPDERLAFERSLGGSGKLLGIIGGSNLRSSSCNVDVSLAELLEAFGSVRGGL